MTELSRKILSSYQVRKNKKQKTDFIEFMKRELPELQVEEGGMLKSRNLIVGDVKKARVVMSAHYDTCAALPVPNLIMPKNFFFTILYGVLIAVPFLALMVAVEIALQFLTDNFYLAYWGALWVFLASYFAFFLGGKPNQHTANDNTSGVIVLCEMIKRCKEKGIDDVAFVFFDHEELGLFGSSYFRKLHKNEMKEKLLVNVDCVSDGDHLLLVLDKPALDEYGNLIKASFPDTDQKTVHMEKAAFTYYPSDQMGFYKSIAISFMKKKWALGLYLDRIHTKKDTVMDETNIAYVCEGMEKFLLAKHEENT